MYMLTRSNVGCILHLNVVYIDFTEEVLALRAKCFLAFCMTIAIMLLFMTACTEDVVKYTEEDLTATDKQRIECVYSNIDTWEYNISKGGVSLSIQKLSFYEFEPGGDMCFYVSWSDPTEQSDLGYAKYYGTVYSEGYFMFGDDIERIGGFSVYEYEKTTRHEGYIARVSYNGSSWNANASDTTKYDMIVDAYLDYLNGLN